jgi:stage II sporulation protein D
MAAAGQSEEAILAQYFPGAYAADEATGLAWQTLRGSGFVLETLAPDDAAYLPELAKALAEAETVSDLRAPNSTITVRGFRSTGAFRDATLAPGWVAAFTEGDRVATQPLSTLAARKLLGSVLRHEFLHVLIEGQAAPGTPLWLREGLVEALGDQAEGGDRSDRKSVPALRLDQLDHALIHASAEAQSAAAHRAAAFYAGRLLQRYGRAQVLTWLRTGLPAAAAISIDLTFH